MQDGPWNFRGDAVIITPYDGISKPSMVKLETIDIWIQIHDVPDLYSHLVTPLAAKVGEVLFAEAPSHDFVGNFHRVWVRINVLKPLKNAISMIREGKRQIYKVKYEKLPDWCAVCGMLGHLFKEHGTSIHPPSALVFKELRASWFMRNGSGTGGGRGSRGGGRSGGRTGRTGGSRPQNDETDKEQTEQELEMIDADRIMKRGSEPAVHQGQVVPPISDQTSAVTKGTVLALPPPAVPTSPSAIQESKRAKMVAETEKVSAVKNLLLGKIDPKLAGPSDGHRRAQ